MYQRRHDIGEVARSVTPSGQVPGMRVRSARFIAWKELGARIVTLGLQG
jgi:hypothetical protein